jgi:hypothetical protein
MQELMKHGLLKAAELRLYVGSVVRPRLEQLGTQLRRRAKESTPVFDDEALAAEIRQLLTPSTRATSPIPVSSTFPRPSHLSVLGRRPSYTHKHHTSQLLACNSIALHASFAQPTGCGRPSPFAPPPDAWFVPAANKVRLLRSMSDQYRSDSPHSSTKTTSGVSSVEGSAAMSASAVDALDDRWRRSMEVHCLHLPDPLHTHPPFLHARTPC